VNRYLDAALVRDFPKLFTDRNIGPRYTAMCWGFDCGDGWEPIIRRLSAKLERAGVVAVQVKEKFGGLRFYIQGIDQPTSLGLRLRRIFCHLLHLRWCGALWTWTWWKPGTLWRACDHPQAWDWISKAEDESYRTCERCGSPGRLREDRFWYKTLCHYHAFVSDKRYASTGTS
jgi:FAD/FMN-containing dehydrogenase